MTLSTRSARARVNDYLAGVNLCLVKAARGAQHVQGATRPAKRALGGAIWGDVGRPCAPATPKAAPRTPPRPVGACQLMIRACAWLTFSRTHLAALGPSVPPGTDSKREITRGPRTDAPVHRHQANVIRFLANGWPVDRAHGPRKTWRTPAPAIALPVLRKRGDRHEILTFDALCLVCVDDAPLDAILRAYGWTAQDFNRARLRKAILAALAQIATAMGLGPH